MLCYFLLVSHIYLFIPSSCVMYDNLHFGGCLFINLLAQCPLFHNTVLFGYMHGTIAVREQKNGKKYLVRTFRNCTQ